MMNDDGVLAVVVLVADSNVRLLQTRSAPRTSFSVDSRSTKGSWPPIVLVRVTIGIGRPLAARIINRLLNRNIRISVPKEIRQFGNASQLKHVVDRYWMSSSL